MSKIKNITEFVKKMPNTTGVYLMKDDSAQVIYVGKAKNIKKRVSQYFQKNKTHSRKTKALVSNVADIEIMEVQNELEALILETNLIKKYQPRYNILMRDDKNFCYIEINKQDDYPIISITRYKNKDNCKYYGPYLSKVYIKKTLDFLRKILPYRHCNLIINNIKKEDGSIDVSIKNKTISYPCLYFHIKRCLAPCVNNTSIEEYEAVIKQAENFLSGRYNEVENLLTERIATAAKELKFEQAALLRDKLIALKETIAKQYVSSTGNENSDYINYYLESNYIYFNILNIRNGHLINNINIRCNLPSDIEEGEVDEEEIVRFMQGYYIKYKSTPDTIYVKHSFENIDEVKSILRLISGTSLNINNNVSHKTQKLFDISFTNAKRYARLSKAKFEVDNRDPKKALEEIKENLKLKTIPKRIECYDISHLSGENTVASMIVFKNGIPDKSDYRKFNIRSLKKGEIDDYKSLKEVIERRMQKISHIITYKNLNLKFSKLRAKKDEKTITYQLLDAEKKVLEELISYSPENKTSVLFIKEINDYFQIALNKFYERNKSKKFYIITKSKYKDYFLDQGCIESKNNEKVNKYLVEIEEVINKDEIVLIYNKINKSKDSFSKIPDLIVIDGGKGQLSAVMEIEKKYKSNIDICSIAKKEEIIYQPNNKEGCYLKRDSEGLYLFQRLRDEAHRFAISFQRNKRGKDLQESVLDSIPGIGKLLKMKLLRKFGNIEVIRSASIVDIANEIGMQKAELIKRYLK